jgi:hypothetical protein
MAVVPKPSRIRLPSGTVWRCAVPADLITSMLGINISVWLGISYVHEAWVVGSSGTCHALLPLTCHILALGWHYNKVSHHILHFLAHKIPVLSNICLLN